MKRDEYKCVLAHSGPVGGGGGGESRSEKEKTEGKGEKVAAVITTRLCKNLQLMALS